MASQVPYQLLKHPDWTSGWRHSQSAKYSAGVASHLFFSNNTNVYKKNMIIGVITPPHMAFNLKSLTFVCRAFAPNKSLKTCTSIHWITIPVPPVHFLHYLLVILLIAGSLLTTSIIELPYPISKWAWHNIRQIHISELNLLILFCAADFIINRLIKLD